MAEGGFEEDWVAESGRKDGGLQEGRMKMTGWQRVTGWVTEFQVGFFLIHQKKILQSRRRSLGGMLTQELHWEFKGKIPQSLKPP